MVTDMRKRLALILLLGLCLLMGVGWLFTASKITIARLASIGLTVG